MDVLEIILGHAGTHADRPAAKDPATELNYGELEAAVTAVAAGLSDLGVEPGQRVALHLPNSVDFVVASLACLWVGAIFVSLATTDPAARVAVIIEDCDPTLVLTTEPAAGDAAARRPTLGRRSLPLSALRAGGDRRPQFFDGTGGGGAYAIYTSGTTGTPKGVLISREAFTQVLLTITGLLGLDSRTRALCVSAFHFDGSYGTLYATLVAGGSVVIPPREQLLFPRRFFSYITAESINFTSFSPSYLRLLLASPQLATLAGSELRTVALGGEASSAADVERLQQAIPRARIFNRYGPTETTIAVTHLELTPDLIVPGQPVPIGRPHPGVTFHLVGEDGSIIEGADRAGELYIGGEQLMMGYWGDPGLSAEMVRTDVVPDETVYRSGDVVVRDQTGNYVYVDRANRVVKRNGVRVSLLEIADTLQLVPGIEAAVCVTFDDDGRLGIAAFVAGTPALSPLEIRGVVGQHLPENMFPDVLRLVGTIPVTSSGKVDEALLLADAGLTKA